MSELTCLVIDAPIVFHLEVIGELGDTPCISVIPVVRMFTASLQNWNVVSTHVWFAHPERYWRPSSPSMYRFAKAMNSWLSPVATRRHTRSEVTYRSVTFRRTSVCLESNADHFMKIQMKNIGRVVVASNKIG